MGTASATSIGGCHPFLTFKIAGSYPAEALVEAHSPSWGEGNGRFPRLEVTGCMCVGPTWEGKVSREHDFKGVTYLFEFTFFTRKLLYTDEL